MAFNDKQLIISNAIYTGDDQQPLIDGWIMLEGGKILEVSSDALTQEILQSADHVYDYRGYLITPGLVDAHTHLVFGGSRERELGMKLAGASYMEIHKEGGIKSTVKATREADAHSLYLKATKNLNSMLLHGTTTSEAKSGYGLDLETELRVLNVMKKLDQDHAIDLACTYMGAHDIPKEYESKEAYIDYMIEEVMPKVKEEGLAEFCDIFCEKGIFELEDTKLIGEAALKMGYHLKVHADEIEPMGGAGLAASLGAVSAEHLMAIRDEDIPKMAESGTVAVLLPATTYFLMTGTYAPAKKMIEQGVRVAISSDFNPGSSPCENLQMAMYMACFQMKLSPLEILKGVTINAAHAIKRENEIGSIIKGKKADLCVFNAKDPDELLYHFGVNKVRDVFKGGRLVVHNGNIDHMACQALRADRELAY